MRDHVLAAKALIDCLQAGPVDGENVTVTGSLDLTSLATVEHPIRCHQCHLEGDLRVDDVTFTRAIDFDRVLIDGKLDAKGTRFQGAVLARGDRTAASGITGEADFSLATFEGPATFDALTFGKGARFSGTKFLSSVSFVGTEFAADVDFERASVDGFFVLSGPPPPGVSGPFGAVRGETLLRHAVFAGAVDLSSRNFDGGLDASGATFLARVTMAKATIGGKADAELQLNDATFVELDAHAATFLGPAFVQEVHAGAIDLSETQALGGLQLDGTEVSGSVSFDGANIEQSLGVDKFAAAAIVLDPDALRNVPGAKARRAILGKIEQTARKSGDLSVANEARFRLLQIDGAKSSFPLRPLDWFFYEQLSGYLVRPLRPLRALFLLVMLGTLARYLYDDHRAKHHPDQLAVVPFSMAGQPTKVVVAHEVATFLGRFSRALIASLRPKPNIISPVGQTTVEPYVIAGLRLCEYVASKLLIVVFFLSLGNFNSTLRDVLGSVRL